jgi:arylsulfatase A-like enzyme
VAQRYAGTQFPYHPNARGFQEFCGFCSGGWGTYFDPPLEHNGQPVRGRGYIVDDLTDHALRFIEEHQDGPFFCYVPFNVPHTPLRVSVRTQRYRLDNEGRLFDMMADPGQDHDVAARQPDVTRRLSQAVANWRKEVLPGIRNLDRPFTVGYPDFPLTNLPARDGVPHVPCLK